MTPDITPIVRDWLEEAPGGAVEPVHLYPAIAAHVHATPQQRSFLPRLTGRFQTMFSAIKFAVAGAILALVGGLLLSGVLTQQPADEPPPPAAASASSSPEGEETIAPEQSARADLLPGVDLVLEEVEPGMYRVLSDGVRGLSKRVYDVTVTPEGDVWVELGTSRDWDIVRLGEPGVSRQLGRKEPWLLSLTAAGAPLAIYEPTAVPGRLAFRVFAEGSWSKLDHDDLTEHDRCVMWAMAGSGRYSVAADGGCWTVGADVVHFDAAGTRTVVTRSDLDVEPDRHIGTAISGPDGTIWVPVSRDAEGLLIFDGLLAYDGSTWSFIPYDGDDALAANGPSAAVDVDGVVWVGQHACVSRSPSGDLFMDAADILSWDGASWTSYDVGHCNDVDPSYLEAWPNGTVWFSSFARWDGSSLEVDPAVPWVEELGLTSESVATGPDGSAWRVLGGQLYVITPRP